MLWAMAISCVILGLVSVLSPMQRGTMHLQRGLILKPDRAADSTKLHFVDYDLDDLGQNKPLCATALYRLGRLTDSPITNWIDIPPECVTARSGPRP